MGGSGIADREPCPWRIVDDVGGAFALGNVGGGLWHSIKGARMAPSGGKFRGSMQAIQHRAPVLGGGFAVWGLCFACCDCTFTAIRQKEDPWNAIMGGAATGAFLAARAGPKAMAQAGLVGGVLLGLIEGMGIMMTKYFAPSPDEMLQQQAFDPTAPPTESGYFPSITGSGPSNPLAAPSVESSSTAPPENEPFIGGDTKFSTEPSSETTGNSSWWPFGSSQST